MRTLGLPPPASLAVHRGVSDTGATVAIRGLASPFSILHVSDSHIDGGPEPGREAEAEFMRGVNSQGLPDMSARGDISSAADKLWTQLQTGAQAGARLVAHTGDLVNFPSRKAVALVQGKMHTASTSFEMSEVPIRVPFVVFLKVRHKVSQKWFHQSGCNC